MRRREFISLIGSVAAAWPFVAHAQQTDQRRLIGVLMAYPESDPTAQSMIAVLRNGLSKLGWTEENNLRIELRWGGADPDRVKTFAKELVDLRPALILSHTTAVTGALARETRTIPIVFVNVTDPISSGFATSLARPGGNITGFSVEISEQGGKWVELLKQIAPRTVRMALLLNPETSAPPQYFMPSVQAAASSRGVEISATQVRTKDEIEDVIAAQARNPGSGLIVMPAAFNVANRELIIALAARHGVPAIYFSSLFPKSGGLIAYSPDYADEFRPAAEYIDRILKGAKPGELPIQLGTKFELVINMKTAKALGLDVPVHLQQIADELIE
jgi:putative ABC transport system substrate-binding protein